MPQDMEVAAEPEKKFVAKLDPSGILIGFSVKAADAVTEKDIVTETDDLELNKYRWDEKAGSFVPLSRAERQQVFDKTPMPEQLNACWKGFAAIRDSGQIALPQETLDWVAWCEARL